MKRTAILLFIIALLTVPATGKAMLLFDPPDCRENIEFLTTEVTLLDLQKSLISKVTDRIRWPFEMLGYLSDTWIPTLSAYTTIGITNEMLHHYKTDPKNPVAMSAFLEKATVSVIKADLGYCNEAAALRWAMEIHRQYGRITMSHTISQWCADPKVKTGEFPNFSEACYLNDSRKFREPEKP